MQKTVPVSKPSRLKKISHIWPRIIGGILISSVIFVLNQIHQTSLLRTALRQENVPASLQALKWGAVPDSNFNVKNEGTSIHEYYTGETCLIRALKLGSIRAEPLVRAMISRGADPRVAYDYSGEGNGWDVVFRQRDIALVRAMLDEGAELSTDDVADAALYGSGEILQLLFARGISPHTVANGNTLLHRAATGGSIEAVELLLKLGLDINVPTKSEGETPLMQAVVHDETLMVQYLLKCGASVHRQDYNGRTVLDRVLESLSFQQSLPTWVSSSGNAETDRHNAQAQREKLLALKRMSQLLQAHGARTKHPVPPTK